MNADWTLTPTDRLWLVHANGGRQLIDPRQFDLSTLADQAKRVGGQLVVEPMAGGPPRLAPSFEPPVSALAALFRARLDRVHVPRVSFDLQINTRATNRVLGNYYKTRSLIRIYTHDTELGRRPLDELFETFLHEVAHHLEYTEYDAFEADSCGRVPGTMHSPLFWSILGTLKARWRAEQRQAPV